MEFDSGIKIIPAQNKPKADPEKQSPEPIKTFETFLKDKQVKGFVLTPPIVGLAGENFISISVAKNVNDNRYTLTFISKETMQIVIFDGVTGKGEPPVAFSRNDSDFPLPTLTPQNISEGISRIANPDKKKIPHNPNLRLA